MKIENQYNQLKNDNHENEHDSGSRELTEGQEEWRTWTWEQSTRALT